MPNTYTTESVNIFKGIAIVVKDPGVGIKYCTVGSVKIFKTRHVRVKTTYRTVLAAKLQLVHIKATIDNPSLHAETQSLVAICRDRDSVSQSAVSAQVIKAMPAR